MEKIAKIDSVSPIAKFHINSGAMRVTDPCYDMETWCAGTLDNVFNGGWLASVGYHKCPIDEEHRNHLRQERLASIKSMPDGVVKEYLIKEEQEREESIAKNPGRVAYLHALAEGFESRFNRKTISDEWELADIDVGVDSGQAGLFDSFVFAGLCDDASLKEAFYDQVCELTLRNESFGTVPLGAVSSSGYGDGSYNCYFLRNSSDQIVEVVIVFIGVEEDENE